MTKRTILTMEAHRSAIAVTSDSPGADERQASSLERHGGTVAKFVGDAVMAIFGAPVAHEDDPERAVRAALAIREELAADGDLEVHIGVTTGEALITLDARIEKGEHTASGDSVNTAARLEAAAPAGSIFVDEATRRATERSIEFDDAPPVVAKGKSDPIRVWGAVRPRTPVAGRRASDTPLVGRERELTLLRGTVDRVQREREPQLLTLVGVPGIGKTRLVSELARDLDRRGRWLWLEGRSLPYGEGATFWALCEIVRAFTGVLDSDSDERATRKVHGAVAAVAPEPSEAAWLERHLRPLVGIDTDDLGSGDRRGEAFAAWRRLLEALAEEQPLVLVFDDLHWADDALLDFVDHVVDWASGVPILVLATARPDLLVELGQHDWTANPQMAFDLQTYQLKRERGLLSEMVDVVERAVEEHPTYPVWSYVLLDVDTELGREDRARATFERLAAEGFPLYLEMQWLFGMSLLPEVCRYLDDPEGASAVYARLQPFGHLNATLPPELCRGSVSRGLGILAATMARRSEAVEHFDAALRMNAELGARPWFAHAQYDYARALLRREEPGDRQQVAELLTSAAASARGLGMRSLADKVSSLS